MTENIFKAEKAIIGSTVAGRYKVEAQIGHGGMGAVYRAVQEPLGREIALKVLRGALSDDESANERFIREAKTVSQLNHPNIVTVFDFGVTERGLLFIAMELLEGQSLKERIEGGGPLPFSATLPMVRDVAAALSAAHRMGIIHRDLKPDNVMLLQEGPRSYVKLLDFGVAKLLDKGGGESEGTPNLTGTGMLVGTPGYMAPEVVLQGITTDPRSDLYSVGVLWWESLVGRPMFTAPTPVALVMRHATESPPRPTAVSNDLILPVEAENLIMLLLEKDPDKRPADADSLSYVLEQFISGGTGERTAPSITALKAPAAVRLTTAPGFEDDVTAPKQTMLLGTPQRAADDTEISLSRPGAIELPATEDETRTAMHSSAAASDGIAPTGVMPGPVSLRAISGPQSGSETPGTQPSLEFKVGKALHADALSTYDDLQLPRSRAPMAAGGLLAFVVVAIAAAWLFADGEAAALDAAGCADANSAACARAAESDPARAGEYLRRACELGRASSCLAAARAHAPDPALSAELLKLGCAGGADDACAEQQARGQAGTPPADPSATADPAAPGSGTTTTGSAADPAPSATKPATKRPSAKRPSAKKPDAKKNDAKKNDAQEPAFVPDLLLDDGAPKKTPKKRPRKKKKKTEDSHVPELMLD